jgi:invasion protein IalB
MTVLNRAGFIVLAGLAFVSPPSSRAQSGDTVQPAGEANQPANTWTTQCSGATRTDDLDCAIEQRVVLTQTGQLLAALTLRIPSGTREPVLMVHVPIGVFLPSGLNVVVDDALIDTLQVQTCDQNGCYAGSSDLGALLEAMKRGSAMMIGFQDLAKQEIAVPISLAGFAAAYSSIE